MQQNPHILQPMLNELGKQNPQLLALINANQVRSESLRVYSRSQCTTRRRRGRLSHTAAHSQAQAPRSTKQLCSIVTYCHYPLVHTPHSVAKRWA